MNNFFLKLVWIGLIISTALSTAAHAVTVVEYYNSAVDAHFLTGRDNEKQLLDANSSFRRTGMTFEAAAQASAPASLTKICRFYISITSPYVSSHFYGRQGIDCESLLAAAPVGFSYEGYDFAVAQPVGGVCPVGTTLIYRGFRIASGGKTSNHRYTSSQTSYAAAAAAGYIGEGVAFWAPSATDITPVGSGFSDCIADLKVGDTYVTEITLGGYSIGGISIPGTTKVTRTTVVASPSSATFNGRVANRITTTTNDGGFGQTLFEIDTGTAIQTLGTRDAMGNETVNTPPIERPKTLAVSQSYSYDTTQTTSGGSVGTVVATSRGTVTFRGRDAVLVPAGDFPSACKFEFTSSGGGSAFGVASSAVTTGTNWSKGGLPLKSEIRVDGTVPGFGNYTYLSSVRTLSATVAP